MGSSRKMGRSVPLGGEVAPKRIGAFFVGKICVRDSFFVRLLELKGENYG
jgi:hypothetical protein